MVWTGVSPSAWFWGESLGKSVGCCSAEGTTLVDGSEKRPPRSVAATVACSFSGEDGDVSELAGATADTAEATAARRANLRRKIPLEVGGFLGSLLVRWCLAQFFWVA